MSGRFFYYAVPRKSKSRSGNATKPIDLRGRPATGRICSLLVGQGHGQIRLRDGLTIFFHRADLNEGTAFNDLQVGDTVSFELLDDRVSGPRALRVCRRQR
jgi:cold shock CspA family protein